MLSVKWQPFYSGGDELKKIQMVQPGRICICHNWCDMCKIVTWFDKYFSQIFATLLL